MLALHTKALELFEQTSMPHVCQSLNSVSDYRKSFRTCLANKLIWRVTYNTVAFNYSLISLCENYNQIYLHETAQDVVSSKWMIKRKPINNWEVWKETNQNSPQ